MLRGEGAQEENAAVTKEGVLMKKINNRNWKSRYVVLKVRSFP